MNYKNLKAEELKKVRKEQPDAVVLDVRTPAEVRQGKIPGASTIDNLLKKIENLDKNKTYLLYCRSGNRSAQACAYMAGKGFTHLYNLRYFKLAI